MGKNHQLREFRNLMASFKKTATIKECFYHDKSKCKGDIKQSHSIQRNGRLSIIEDDVNGNQSIYTFTSSIPSEQHLMDSLKPLGKKEASTFFGFCDFHDTTLFNPIENFAFDNSDKHLFLHSYRSFAHSYHRKVEDSKVYNDTTSAFIKAMPKERVEIQKLGIAMALKDSAERKKQLDYYIENEIYDELQYLVYEKPGLYPFAVSSQISPKVSYKNNPMNNHIDPNVPFSQPMLSFLPDKTTTFTILAAFPDDKPAVNLLDELDALSDIQVERAITSLIMANCENTFFSPKFWNSLNNKEKRRFLDEFEMHTPDNPTYLNKFFHSSFNFFDPRFEMNKLSK